MIATKHNIHLGCLLLFINGLHMRPHILEEMLNVWMDIDEDIYTGKYTLTLGLFQ